MTLYFVTMNEFKGTEVAEYLGSAVDLRIVRYRIQEILHLDVEVVARDKVLKAYHHLGRPCVVEHGGILIDALNNLPGGLSKVVWDTVGEQLCTFPDAASGRSATAQSVVAYCDGKRVYTFRGETKGTLAQRAQGGYLFQWDPIFIPAGQLKTYAEMGFPEKGQYSQAAKAWKMLLTHIESKEH